MTNNKIRARLSWIRLYEEIRDFCYVCRRCGISRPTLRKWYQRYIQCVIEGLIEISRKPHNSPNKKINKRFNSKNYRIKTKI